MRARELMKLLVDHSGRTAADIDIRGRELRNAGYVSTGPRGLSAPHLDNKSAAAFLIALASSANASQCVPALRCFMKLRIVGEPAENFMGAHNFGAAIEAALSNVATGLAEVRLIHPVPSSKSRIDGAAAIIKWRRHGNERKSIYVGATGFKNLDKALAQTVPVHLEYAVRDSTTIGYQLVALVASKLSVESTQLDSDLVLRDAEPASLN